MATKTKPKTAGDVVLHMESLQANMISINVDGAAAVTNDVTQIAGYPVIVAAGTGTLLKTTEMATATHLLVHGDPIVALAAGATAPGKYSAIGIDVAGAGGNIVINEAALPTKTTSVDCGGTAWAGADADHIALKDALDGLGFKFVDEPSTNETQST